MSTKSQAPTPPYSSDLATRLSRFLERYSHEALRVSLGLIYLWFGALKLLPGVSPAEDLALKTLDVLTFGLLPGTLGLLLLAGLECAIGVGFLSGRTPRLTLALMAFQMLGAMSPLLLFPAETFTVFPLVPTLEGQYIIKNLVLIAGAMVLAVTVGSGRAWRNLLPRRGG